jgi:protoheme IX farnesyltransferase
MSFAGDQNQVLSGTARISLAEPKDYFALLKPRVMQLVVLTALAGLLIAPNPVHPVIGFVSILAIAVGAGASGALNMWYDADVDALMTRTRVRPIPSGRIEPGEALAFGLTLSIFSVLTHWLAANWQSAALLAFTIFFYVAVYTMWLKRWTPQNIVIGGAAGAFPPVVGYLAATGTVSVESLVLFAIIFIWTPPHFWALALVKSAEYERAGLPMMPNVKGPDRTRLEILLYTLVLAPVGCLPWIMGFASLVFGLVAMVGGAAMVYYAVQVFRTREGDEANKASMRLFGVSILYLFALFIDIIVERCIPIFGGMFQ